MLSLDATLFCQSESLLGEGTIWHRDRLYWVDILQSELQSCDGRGQDRRALTLPSHVGAAAPWPGGFIAGTQQGIGILTPEGAFHVLPDSPRLAPGLRFNDGKLDPQGRFWCGTMDYSAAPHAGSLYRVEQNGRVTCVLDGITIANGLAWNESAGRFYYIDTITHRVDVFDFDPPSGAIANRRTAFELPAEYGLPDGMSRDSSGRLWIAFWRGGQVIGFAPDTWKPVYRIQVPTRLTSSCWIHEESRTLYITSARTELSPAQLVAEPLAGSVFCAALPDA
jgi:D-xylonolactonase